VRTKAAFHEIISTLASQGMAILLISSDLPEIVTLADRITVMADFTVRGDLVNSHGYDRMSQAIIRLIHVTGEPPVPGGSGEAPAEAGATTNQGSASATRPIVPS
jgi:ribose transport system ATP-binding protein